MAHPLSRREPSMPWFCFTGFNLLVIWNFATFSLDSSAVLGEGTLLNIISMPWLVFSGTQAVAMAIYAIFSTVIQRRIAESAWLPHISWISALITAAGLFAMLSPHPALSTIGAIGAGLASSWMWLLWALFFARLETGRAEGIIVRSVVGSVAVVVIFLALDPTVRFAVAQIVPFFSVFCSLKSISWAESSFQAAPDKPFNLMEPDRYNGRIILTMLGAGPLPTAREVFGLFIPAFIVFLLIPFMTHQVELLGYGSVVASTILGFGLAALLTYLFLHSTPSITLSFIFRWQVPLIACSLVVFALAWTPVLSSLLLTASLIVISEFTWICLCSLMRLHQHHTLQVFMGGYFVFNSGIFIGSLSAAWLVPLYSDTPSFTTLGYLLLLLIIFALSIMVFAPSGEESHAFENGSGKIRPPKETGEQLIYSDQDKAFYEKFGITPREREIIGYLKCGRSVPFIRDELFISQNTVNTHIKHIYAKVAVNSRQELLDVMETFRS